MTVKFIIESCKMSPKHSSYKVHLYSRVGADRLYCRVYAVDYSFPVSHAKIPQFCETFLLITANRKFRKVFNNEFHSFNDVTQSVLSAYDSILDRGQQWNFHFKLHQLISHLDT